MGCDIHLYVEKKIDGQWQILGDFEREENDDGGTWISGGRFYSGRNYNLFAILADVRNGRGFAGCKTGEGFQPISEPRGVPDDASPEYKAIVDQWDVDGHSHSFHTLRQLLDYDWTQATGLQGWLNMVEWEKWTRWQRAKGEGPDSYCGGVDGPDVQHISAEEADALFAGVDWHARQTIASANREKYALAQWKVPYHDAAHSFWTHSIPNLLKLAGGIAGADDVRIVFFFDN